MKDFLLGAAFVLALMAGMYFLLDAAFNLGRIWAVVMLPPMARCIP